MASIRIHIIMNPGGEGIPLQKLADISKDFERFLGCLADDCRLPDRDKWLAINFANGSFKTDVVHMGRSTDEQALLYTKNLHDIIKGTALPRKGGDISHRTFSHFANLAAHLSVGENIGMGVYAQNNTPHDVDMCSVTQSRLSSLRNALDDEIDTFGAIRGTLHSIVRDKTAPYVEVNDLDTKLLVKCFYEPQHYRTIVSALEPTDALLDISGDITISRTTERIKSMHIAEIAKVAASKHDLLDRFFGCVPRVTGKLSSEAAVAKVRHG